MVSEGVDEKGGNVFHVVCFYSSKGGRSSKVINPLILAARQLRETSAVVSAIDLANEANQRVFEEEDVDPNSLPMIKIFSPEGEVEDYYGRVGSVAKHVLEKINKFVSDNLASLMPLLAPKQKIYKTFKKDKSKPRLVMLLEPKGKGKKRKAVYDAVQSLSLYFEGRVNFAYSKYRKVAKALGAGDLPAVFFIPEGKKFSDAYQYAGTLAYRPLRNWLSQFAEEAKPPAVVPQGSSIDYIPELASQGCMEKFCSQRGGICVLSLLPVQSLSSREVEYYLESMRIVRRGVFDKLGLATFSNIHFGWMDSGEKGQWLEDAFGLPMAEYVRTVVWYPKKNKFGQYVGSFNAPELSKWISMASRGKATVEPLPVELDALPDLPSSGDAETCEDLKPGDILPDEVVVAGKPKKRKGMKEGIKGDAGQRPDSIKGQPRLPNIGRFPRPNSKAGKNFALDAESFEPNVIGSPAYWLVWFQTGEPTTEEEECWTKAARNLKGMIQFGTVADPEATEKILKQYDISTEQAADLGALVRIFPAVKNWYEEDNDKVVQSEWVEDINMDDENDIMDYAFGLLKGTNFKISRVENANGGIQGWFQRSMAPEAGGEGIPEVPKSKILFFPSKDLKEPPYLLRALEIEYGHIFDIGMAKRSEEEFAASLQVSRWPSLVIMLPRPKPGADPGSQEIDISIMQYPANKKLVFNSIVRFLDSTFQMHTKPPGFDGAKPPPKRDEL